MYLVLAALVPVLYLFNPRLAMAGLIVAIIWMVARRTQSSAAPKRPKRPAEQEFTRGYD